MSFQSSLYPSLASNQTSQEIVQQADIAANLDQSDWPSLNDELTYTSLNITSTTSKVNTIPFTATLVFFLEAFKSLKCCKFFFLT